MFAIWSSHRPDSPPQLVSPDDRPTPPSEQPPPAEHLPPAQVRLALPDGHGSLAPHTVSCAIVPPAELNSVRTTASAGPTLQAWRGVVGGHLPDLPPAGHAVLDPTETAMTSADYALVSYRRTTAVGHTLANHLNAHLRPYQVRGVAWLTKVCELHHGGVLADEMGLGKTLQAIGLLAIRASVGPALVVCPKSLIRNWQREIDRFAPGLRESVTIVSYPRLRLDAHVLSDTSWATVIFDEAQALKNSRTQVHRAARTVPAEAKVALTGTPIENDLDDLWAILHVVTPGRFAHRAVFRRRFTRAIADGDYGALGRLRSAVAPVMLARSKKVVAAALPPKIDNPLHCDLTAEQAVAYDRCLDEAEGSGFGVGVQRQGKVLATLTKLKQICNHPGLLTGDLTVLSGRSGKLDACMAILADNIHRAAPTLIFTQYRTTGDMLTTHIRTELGVTAAFYHGGLSSAERDRCLHEYQSPAGPPILILSVKAGGVGLNLTRACEVIHFDRWWNPAVEAQASDRAHRIGQDRPVTVSTLTTTTTIEEHIADMHHRKSALTAHAETSMVTELARLTDERLMALLRRSQEEG